MTWGESMNHLVNVTNNMELIECYLATLAEDYEPDCCYTDEEIEFFIVDSVEYEPLN
jgi:hypothetical protein